MLKLTKRSFFATLLMCSLSFASVSNFAYAEEKKSETEKVTENKSVAEPPSGPNVQGEKKEKEVEVETPASVTGKKVQGTGTVTDFTTNGSKAFYTINDKDNNVFYLIIDLDKTQNNVYFLSDVKKSALDGTATGKDNANVKPNIPNQKQAEAEKTTANTKTTPEQPKGESNNNSFLLIVLLLAVAGIAVYYFLVIKKKKNQTKKNEDEEAMEDDYYEDNFEDERNKHNKED